MNAIGGILTLVCFFALLFISGFSVGFLTIIQLLAIFGAYILFVFFAFKFNLGDFSFSILGPGNGAPSSSSSSSPYKRPAFMESEEKNEPESKPSEVNEPKDDGTDWMFHGDN